MPFPRNALPIGGVVSLCLWLGVPIVLPHADPLIGWMLIGLALVFVVFWLGTLAVGSTDQQRGDTHVHVHLGDLREALGVPGEGPLPPLSVTPPPIEARLNVIEEPDTLKAAGKTFVNQNTFFPPTVRTMRNLYVGQVIVSASRLVDEHTLEIAVRAFNGSTETLRMIGVEGAIRAGVGSARGKDLPRATWRPEHCAEPIPSGSEFTVVLDQPLSSALVEEYLAGMEDGYVSLDLRGLDVLVQSEEAPGLRERLPLWHGATLRRHWELFTGRIIMATVGTAVSVETAITPGD